MRGRKVTVLARDRTTAASGLRALLFQLDERRGAESFLVKESQWSYYDHRGQKHGPFPFDTMLVWISRMSFPSENLPVQLEGLGCWVPLWLLPHLKHFAKMLGDYVDGVNDEDMIDVDTAIIAVRETRGKRTSQVQHSALQKSIAEDFPEASDPTATAMDYEPSVPQESHIQMVRVFVIVDTSVLLSHLYFTQKVFVERFSPAAPVLEAILVIPWATLCELDRLKDVTGRPQASYMARKALHWIRSTSSARDSFVHIQTAKEHQSLLMQRNKDTTALPTLENDDLIISTCEFWQNKIVKPLVDVGYLSAAILFSNDRGMCVRANANGLHCFSAMDFPATPAKLFQIVSSRQGMMRANRYPMVHDHAMKTSEGVYSRDGTAQISARDLQNDVAAKSDLDNSSLKQKELHFQSDKSFPSDMNNLAAILQQRMQLSGHPASINEILASLHTIYGNNISSTNNSNESTGNGSHVGGQTGTTFSNSNLQVANAPYPSHIDAIPVQGERNSVEMDPGCASQPLDLNEIIKENIGPAVAFYRQQDLGSLWLELLEEDLRPPWDADGVLKVIVQHGTTFWEYLNKGQLDSCRRLQRDLKKRSINAHEAAELLRPILLGLYEGLKEAATSGEAPDPADVPEFVSLGDARSALESGISKLNALQ